MTAPRARRRNQSTFAALAATLTHRIRAEYPPPELARRDAHPKHHGCVSATFTVLDTCPEDLRHGVFQPGATYDALIRFSNAFKLRHDLERDARGMAIKLRLPERDTNGKEWTRVRRPDLDGTPVTLPDEGALTQDFLLVTHSQFFGRNAAEFLETINAIVAGGGEMNAVTRSVLGSFLMRRRWREAIALFRSFIVTKNPLFETYFSQTPYRVGPADASSHSHAVKFCARSRQPLALLPKLLFRARALRFMLNGRGEPNPNFLRRALREYLAVRDAEFDFCIQRRTHPDRMPLDDATRAWSTRRSPYIRVATVRIHQDDCYRDDGFVDGRLALGERLTFSPWHAVEEHRPLGSINRARLYVYAMVSRTRTCHNGTNARVP
jgi:hypothetical protein